MADEKRERGYPPPPPPSNANTSSRTSVYPPPPGEEDGRSSQYQLPPVAALPSMSSYPPPPPPPTQGQAHGYPPDQRYQADQRYSRDQRGWSSESPTNQNGYAPPDTRYPLPPPPPSHTSSLPPTDPRQFDERRPYDEQRPQYDRPFGPDRYYQAQGPPPPRGGYPPPDSYGYAYGQHAAPGYGYADYSRAGPGVPQTGAAPPPHAAPRQRTSIACRYCRKRKIRCSGYANTNNGKCTNCDKLRIDCVFQPVSSNASTAFVPVSAVPGGVPPGTPLFGAYGQPLGSQQQSQQRSYPQHPASEYPSLNSPTTQYAAAYDDRDPSRRRTRPPEDDHTLRLPPPNYPPDDDPRRRSPVSNNSGTPPTTYHAYPHGSYDPDRAATPHRSSPGHPAAAVPSQAPTQVSAQPVSAVSSNPMSLDHLVGPGTGDRGPSHDIDRNMLGRLNSRR